MFVSTVQGQIVNVLVFVNMFSRKYMSGLHSGRSISKMLNKDSSAFSFGI